MKVMLRPRGKGKTFECVQWVLEGRQYKTNPITHKGKKLLMKSITFKNNRVLLVHSYNEKKRIRGLYRLQDSEVEVFNSAVNNALMGRRLEGVVVDNVDLIIQMLLRGNHVEMITLTEEEE